MFHKDGRIVFRVFRISITVCLLSIALTKHQSVAFNSFPYFGLNIHQDITLAALQTYFCPTAMSSISGANTRQDLGELDNTAPYYPVKQGDSYKPQHHFDRNVDGDPTWCQDDVFHVFDTSTDAGAFNCGRNYVDYERGQIIGEIKSVGDPAQALQPLEEIGQVLHAIQDFFSHSNYVDLSTSDRTQALAALFDRTIRPPAALWLTGYSVIDGGTPRVDPKFIGDLRPHDRFSKDSSSPKLFLMFHNNEAACSQTNPICIDPPANGNTKFVNARQAAIEASKSFVELIRGGITTAQWDNFIAQSCACNSGSSGTMSTSASVTTSASNTCPIITVHLPVQPVSSLDPNDKVGPHGSGPGQSVSGRSTVPYSVYFENENTATAPTQAVKIADTLSTNLDPSTVTLGQIAFSNQVITPPTLPLSGFPFATTVDLRPTTNLLVKINASLNTSTGVVTWIFKSLDPATNLPPTDPLAGFLPPGAEGSVFFTVMPKSTVTTGTVISNTATVAFDNNAPINTPTWSNTIDNTKPTSHISPLPASESTTSFMVSWTASDVGSGVRDTTIYVSDNGGPFTAWLTNTTVAQANYTSLNNHTYSFYSIARDLVGNVENAKTSAESTTRIMVSDTTPPVIIPQITGTLGNNGWYRSSVVLIWSVNDPESGIASSNGCAPTTLPTDTAGVTLTCSALNGAGLSTSIPVTIKIDKTPPTISGMPAAGCSIWPPNDKLVQVSDVKASDVLSGVVPGSLAVTASSNEPSSDPRNPQFVITPDGAGGFTVQLLGDRLGTGIGRVYTINASVMDNAGNTATAAATCSVPHDQGN